MSTDYASRYRMYKLGGFAHNFEKILLSIGKGTFDPVKFTSMTYFMSYAKGIFTQMNLPLEVKKVDYLSREWEYWVQMSVELERQKPSYSFGGFLVCVEKMIMASFDNIVLDADDYKLKSIVSHDVTLYYEYVKNLLGMRQKEVLYDILSNIWLNIYANKTISLQEIQQIVQRLKVPEGEMPPDFKDTVDEKIDDGKVNLGKNEVESTPLGFKKALKTMMPLLEIFRDNFYKDTEIKTKLNNAEIYTFSLLVTASKIIKNNDNVKSMLKDSYLICKRIHNYNLIKTLSKYRGIDEFIVNDFISRYEKILSMMVLDLFEKGIKLTAEVEKTTSGSATSEGSEEEKKKILIYSMKEMPIDVKHLAGLVLTHDDVSTIIELLKSGDKIVNVSVDVEPYHLKFSELSPISLIYGSTGCLSKDTKIPVILVSGELVHLTLSEIYAKFENSVFDVKSFNFSENRIEDDKAVIIPSGRKQLYKVIFKSGRVVYATDEHTFFRKNESKVNEVKLKDLKVGDELFVSDD